MRTEPQAPSPQPGTSNNFAPIFIEKDTTETNQCVNMSNLDASDYSECEQCGKLVSAWDLPEHLDFHFAQQLQKEVVPVASFGTKRKSDFSSGNSNKKKKVQGSQKTLDRFFKK